ncbi:MAG: hypothetical protein JJD93_19070 [Ilumatobacteraceae bacterium]|nr:hypothetical protein [Ilumatobacteraceae bacterium]
MKLGIVGVVGAVLAAVSVVGGCSTTDVAVHSVSAREAGLSVPKECGSEWMTLATATEAYLADTGAYPADQAALVDSGLIHEATEDFEASNASGRGEWVGAKDCEGFVPN